MHKRENASKNWSIFVPCHEGLTNLFQKNDGSSKNPSPPEIRGHFFPEEKNSPVKKWVRGGRVKKIDHDKKGAVVQMRSSFRRSECSSRVPNTFRTANNVTCLHMSRPRRSDSRVVFWRIAMQTELFISECKFKCFFSAHFPCTLEREKSPPMCLQSYSTSPEFKPRGEK